MIARGGLWLVIAPAVAVAAFLAVAVILSSYVAFLLTIPFGIIFLGFAVFFRDPPRIIGRGIVSPADGKVVDANPDTRHVAIYMSVLSVHVNRAPWACVVRSQQRHLGGHVPASSPAASKNVSLEWQLDSAIGEIALVQITGLFARRIVPYLGEGARIKKGQKIGMIRFGSRVEIVLPPTVRLVVKAGDRVRAGETTIAEVAHAR